MRSLTIPVIAAVIVVLIGCNQKEDADAIPSKHSALRPSELSAIELADLTNSFYERASSGDYSVLESDEYREIDAAHGPVFKKELIAAIQKSESITIEEHSDQVDFLMLHWPYSDKLPHYVYRTVRLNNAQKAAFLQAAVVMDNSTVEGVTRCFEPHHRMEFVQNNGNRSSMSICFHCERVVWADANLDPPKGLFDVLEEVVKGSGLETERDWCALAKQQSEPQGGTDQPATAPQPKSDRDEKVTPESEVRPE